MADTHEIIGLKPARNTGIQRARAMARLLDSAARVPGTNIRFGLDAVLGLVPGLGDAAGAAFSGYLILLGSRTGLPKHVITRMVANVAVDTIVGAVPVLGDLFDVAWKSNSRNLALLEEFSAPAAREKSAAASWGVVIAAITILALLLAGGIWLAVLAIRALAGAVS